MFLPLLWIDVVDSSGRLHSLCCVYMEKIRTFQPHRPLIAGTDSN